MISPRKLPDWTPTAVVNGRWWPKGNPDLRYPGKLSIDGGRYRLTVTAPFIGQEVFALGRAPTIFGEIDGPAGVQKITLWDRSHNHFEHEANGTDHSQRYTHVIVGAHLEDYALATFRFSAVKFHDLGNWSRFRIPVPESAPDHLLAQHSVATLASPYRDLNYDDHAVSVHLEYPGRVETNDRFPAGAQINHLDQDARIVFDVSPPASAKFHELLLLDAQALLTFCYQGGSPVQGEWLSNESDRWLPVHREDSFSKERVFQHLGTFQMFLTPAEYSFGELLKSWWKALDDDFPAPQVLTTYLHHRRGLLEQSTASALAATENIHSSLGRTQERFPPDVIAANRVGIKNAFPGNGHAPFRQFLYEKLQENRPTLETRLDELLDLVTPSRMNVLQVEPEAWKLLFKNVRNKLAHTGAHVLRRAEPSDDLERINSQTRAILSLLLLLRMGATAQVLDRSASILSKFPHRSW